MIIARTMYIPPSSTRAVISRLKTAYREGLWISGREKTCGFRVNLVYKEEKTFRKIKPLYRSRWNLRNTREIEEKESGTKGQVWVLTNTAEERGQAVFFYLKKKVNRIKRLRNDLF